LIMPSAQHQSLFRISLNEMKSTSSSTLGKPLTSILLYLTDLMYSVKEVTPEYVVYTAKDPQSGELKDHRIPANFVLWSTGIAMNPFTKTLSDMLPNQVHKKVCFPPRNHRIME
jgi:NADH dehydrogenase FAD-containing subunit